MAAPAAGAARGSAWNAAGTFEERTFGPWLRGRLKELLLAARLAGRLSVELKPGQWLCARGVSGWGASSADIVIARGKARYVYDLHFAVEFEVLGEEEARALALSPAALSDDDVAATADEPKAADAPAPAPAAAPAADAAVASAAEPGAAVVAAAAVAAAPVEKAEKKPAPRVRLTIEAGAENEEGGRDLAVVGGKPKPSDGTLERARAALDVKARAPGAAGVVAAVCEALEAALAEYRAK